MPAKSEKPLVRLNVRIFEEDYKAILETVEATDVIGGVNRIIRECVHAFVRQTKALERERIDRLNLGQIVDKQAIEKVEVE